MKKSIVEQKILQAKTENRLAIIPFIMADYPDAQTFYKTLEELDANGADIIEIGIPFSDPAADGPIVEAASRQAITNGASIGKVLDELIKRSYKFKAALVLVGYINPFFQYGYTKLAEKAVKAGVSACMAIDLPLEEEADFRKILAANNIDLISFIGPNTSFERMKEYAKTSTGYVYVLAHIGPPANSELPKEALDTIERAKKTFNIPVALDFEPQNIAEIKKITINQRPDAIILGSAFLSHLNNKGNVANFMHKWQQ